LKYVCDIVVKIRFTFAISSSDEFLVVFSFPYFFVSVPCARLSWPSRQLLSACKYTVSYRIPVSYRIQWHFNTSNTSPRFGTTPRLSEGRRGRERLVHTPMYEIL